MRTWNKKIYTFIHQYTIQKTKWLNKQYHCIVTRMGSEKFSKHEFMFLNSTLKYALGLDWFLFYYICWFIPTKSCWFLSSISTNEERIWRIRSSFYNPSRVEQAIFRAQSTYIKHSLIAIIFTSIELIKVFKRYSPSCPQVPNVRKG